MKISLALLLSLSILAPRIFAEDTAPAKPTVTYLEDLQTKLDHVARRANQPVGTGSSVAGLRGSKQEPISKQLYWKGKISENPVAIEEVKLFRTGVEEARAGNMTEANATLKMFLEKYPKSSLKPDVEETVKVLASLPVPAAH